MGSSKLTSKYQATIPKKIREKLFLRPGDSIVFCVVDEDVIVKKTEPLDKSYNHALGKTLGEWYSKEDEDAFRDL